MRPTTQERARMLAQLFDQFGEPATMDELGDWLVQGVESVSQAKVATLWWRVRYNAHASNTHGCPIRGETNWTVKDSLPTGYPAMTGRIYICYDSGPGWYNDWDHPSSEPLNLCSIDTGSGGSGGHPSLVPMDVMANYSSVSGPHPHHYSWEVRIWLDDFPKLAKWVERQHLISGLAENQIAPLLHTYVYSEGHSLRVAEHA